MKPRKIIVIMLGVVLFLLLNGFDRRYYQPNVPALDSNWSNLVFGIDTDESIAKLQIKYITVDNDGDIQHFLSNAATPVEALTANGYSVSSMNRVLTTSPANMLTNNAYIIIQTYRTIIEDISVSIPYERLIKGETMCEKISDKVIEQRGVLGVMTQTIKKTYQGGNLVATDIVNQVIQNPPIDEIVLLKGPNNSPDEVAPIDAKYPCDYWGTYIDNVVSATDEEKQWMKFTMLWESGCNADSNKGYYKGLFQWDPCIWYEQYSKDNIFDGKAQIRNTLDKLRKGGRPQYMWPAVYKKYVAIYGELSWL